MLSQFVARASSASRLFSLTHEHEEIRRSTRRFVETEINPHVDEWEEAARFPAHKLFPKLAGHGFPGIDKPESYGGLGLDFSYVAVFTEEMGRRCACGGVPMAVSVHTSMCTPALALHGSDPRCRTSVGPWPSIRAARMARCGGSRRGYPPPRGSGVGTARRQRECRRTNPVKPAEVEPEPALT
jgi:citronellyl-CoA dehydrogenase